MLKNTVKRVIMVPDNNSETGELSNLIHSLTVASVEVGFISILPSSDYNLSDIVEFTITYSTKDEDEIRKIVEKTLGKSWNDCTK